MWCELRFVVEVAEDRPGKEGEIDYVREWKRWSVCFYFCYALRYFPSEDVERLDSKEVS